jgi:RNA polymerase sigma-70 factor, ECF subfamily
MRDFDVNDAPKDNRDDYDHFATMISNSQRRLYLYIYSLVHRSEDARDVLQETNLALWCDASRVTAVADFQSWAYRVAFNQVLAHRKPQGRSRLQFDDALVHQLATDMQSQADRLTDNQIALRSCEQKLPEHSRRLLAMRYASGLSVKAISEQLGSTIAAVSKSLYRIRLELRRCVQGVLHMNGSSQEIP